MSLILCPECGTKISDKARTCPHCGFMSDDNSRPISEQDTYEMVPTFCYDIEEWKPTNGHLSVVAVEDNKSLVQFFGQWKNIEQTMPAIADVIQQIAKKENILVAKMDKYVKELIDRGVILNAIDAATEAKRVLIRNFSENLQFISDNSDKNDVQLFIEGKKGRDIPQKVSDSFQDLVAITNSVQTECEGYAILGEFESSKESLLHFKHFIKENHLDDRDTLLLLNENTPQQKIPIVNEFMMISERITNFDASNMISGQNILRIADYKNESKEN